MHENPQIRDPLDCHITNRLDCRMFPYILDCEPNSHLNAPLLDGSFETSDW